MGAACLAVVRRQAVPNPKPIIRCESKKTKTGCLTWSDGSNATKRGRAAKVFSGPNSRETRASAIPIAQQLDNFQGDEVERRLFDFFRAEIAHQIGGFLEEDFWATTLLQLGHSERFVLQTIVAITAFFEQGMNHLGGDYFSYLVSSRTWEYYQRALEGARQRTQASGSDLVTILSCPLFLCMEFLQRRKIQSMVLFLNGRALMQMFDKQSQITSNSTITRRCVSSMFDRLTMMSRLFGHYSTTRPQPSININTRAPSTFDCLRGARDALFKLLMLAHEFIKNLNEAHCWRLPAQALSEEELQQRKQLLVQLEKWSWNLHGLVTDLGTSAIGLSATLRMWYLTAVIWLNNPLEGCEMSFDSSYEWFQTVIHHAKEVLMAQPEKRRVLQFFTFEMGILAPLYYTAVKCRHFTLRNQALDCMRRAPRQEGLWRRDELVYVASRAIELETTPDPDITTLPSESQRILKVKIFQTSGVNEIKAAFTYMNNTIEEVWNVP
ncbi:uncharacterized protein A1O9_09345 [Exophiala aquamarina CBS 119918]|uniref:Transcription factor domain-containing protein n=1 Tax=Exophiala aquamarina CBS 119918 TaxID=1182545 RepID=A0A072P5A3_9EURO|nr:uncharacterized protein A1O9_09345 [Exophiala aquamarina CBS 119918]KEF54902.1 hypothetical protein A1O9_09345 [Exophiala aquamarina CBS 119918]